MSVNEASSVETPYGRYITSEGWFVLNLQEALAVRNAEKGGATYPIEAREHPFENLGVHLGILWPDDPNALYHSEGAQEGFLVLSGECTLIVEEEERRSRHTPTGPASSSRFGCHGRSGRPRRPDGTPDLPRVAPRRSSGVAQLRASCAPR
jgi:hypothetical protein